MNGWGTKIALAISLVALTVSIAVNVSLTATYKWKQSAWQQQMAVEKAVSSETVSAYARCMLKLRDAQALVPESPVVRAQEQADLAFEQWRAAYFRKLASWR